MKGSLDLATVFGISIKIHFTFLILPVLFGITHGVKGVFFIICVFFFVILHELSHSLRAIKNGATVDTIILLPIGGVASMSDLPHEPKQEFLISISGPLSNFLMAAVLFVPVYLLIGADNFYNPSLKTWPQTLSYIFWINPWLGVFNLLPAFPMDGGRVLRAALAQKMDYLKATKIAVSFGQGFALFFAFLGIFSTPPSIILLIIALFIYMAASQEEYQVDIKMSLKNFTVVNVIPKDFIKLTPNTTLGETLEISMHNRQEDFPVTENNVLVGFLDRSKLITNIRDKGFDVSVSEVMRKDFPIADLNEPLIHAYQKMEEADIKSLPVVEKGSLVGIISLEDISRVYSILSDKQIH